MINTVEGMKPKDLFTSDGKDVWEVESFCGLPTVTLKNLRTGKKISGAVGCLNLKDFVPLVPGAPLTKKEEGRNTI